jgi:hypothetical protein
MARGLHYFPPGSGRQNAALEGSAGAILPFPIGLSVPYILLFIILVGHRETRRTEKATQSDILRRDDGLLEEPKNCRLICWE